MSEPTILTVDGERMVAAALSRDLHGATAPATASCARRRSEALAVLARLCLRDDRTAFTCADQRMTQMILVRRDLARI